MKKKILIITVLPIWSMNNKSGGKALNSTIQCYLDSDYEVYLMTDKKNDYSNININKNNIFYIDTSFFVNKLGIRKIGLFMKYLYVKYFSKKCLKIFKQVKDNNFIIYGYEVQAIMAAKKISKKYNLPLITRFQGTIMSQHKNNLSSKIRCYPHLQALSTKSDLVIMTNDGTQGDKVLRNCNNKSKTLFIRNGVNILDNLNEIEKLDTNCLPENKINLLTVSRLENWKKVERSIYALSELNDKKYHLTIVGDGSDKEKLQDLCAELNLSNQVTFTGAVPNSDVYKYMKNADIFLSFYDLSNVGNPLLEALCLGKMIITYNVGDTNKVIDGKNGILLNSVVPQEIAKVIKNLDKKTIKNYEQNAKEYAKNNLYSWDKRMELEYEEVERVYKKHYEKCN